LKGYTYHPEYIFQKGLFSVLTSKREGFALSVMESMANATPVISYDIKYGPNDMIIPNNNGMIIKNGAIDDLADKMIYLFLNPKMAMEMGEKARLHINNHFNEKVYGNKWMKAIDSATKNKNKANGKGYSTKIKE